MNIYINGMELPPKDTVKMLVLFSDGTVIDNTDGQNQWQAIEVPPHGRLINADALPECDLYDPFWQEHGYSHAIIDSALTIIPPDPAEEGG